MQAEIREFTANMGVNRIAVPCWGNPLGMPAIFPKAIEGHGCVYCQFRGYVLSEIEQKGPHLSHLIFKRCPACDNRGESC